MVSVCVCERKRKREGGTVKWFAGPTERLEVRDLENEGVKENALQDSCQHCAVVRVSFKPASVRALAPHRGPGERVCARLCD